MGTSASQSVLALALEEDEVGGSALDHHHPTSQAVGAVAYADFSDAGVHVVAAVSKEEHHVVTTKPPPSSTTTRTAVAADARAHIGRNRGVAAGNGDDRQQQQQQQQREGDVAAFDVFAAMSSASSSSSHVDHSAKVSAHSSALQAAIAKSRARAAKEVGWMVGWLVGWLVGWIDDARCSAPGCLQLWSSKKKVDADSDTNQATPACLLACLRVRSAPPRRLVA